MTSNRKLTHLKLSDRVKKLTSMSAVRRGLTMSQYVTILVEEDGRKTGLGEVMMDTVINGDSEK